MSTITLTATPEPLTFHELKDKQYALSVHLAFDPKDKDELKNWLKTDWKFNVYLVDNNVAKLQAFKVEVIGTPPAIDKEKLGRWIEMRGGFANDKRQNRGWPPMAAMSLSPRARARWPMLSAESPGRK